MQRYLGFVKYYKNCIPRRAEKPNPFYKLLKAEVPINISSELEKTFESANNALNDGCQLALEHMISRKQLFSMTDVGFRSAGRALVIEDNSDQKIETKKKTYAPVAFGSKVFSPHSSRCQFTQKNFWQPIWHFLILHTFCGKHQNRRLF